MSAINVFGVSFFRALPLYFLPLTKLAEPIEAEEALHLCATSDEPCCVASSTLFTVSKPMFFTPLPFRFDRHFLCKWVSKADEEEEERRRGMRRRRGRRRR